MINSFAAAKRGNATSRVLFGRSDWIIYNTVPKKDTRSTTLRPLATDLLLIQNLLGFRSPPKSSTGHRKGGYREMGSTRTQILQPQERTPRS